MADGAGLPLDLTDSVRRRFETARRDRIAEQGYLVLVREHIRVEGEQPSTVVRRRART